METISLARTGHVVTATINNPNSPMNAVDEQLHHDFGELFRMLKMADDELLVGARVIVLTGSGRAFSAGGDMAWFPELRTAGSIDTFAARRKTDHLGSGSMWRSQSCAG